MNASILRVLVCVLVAGLLAGTANALTMATVPVGDPGNEGENSGASGPDMIPGTPDDGYGPDRICGAVGAPYRIGTHEVTAGQYTEFLSKVGGVDTYGLYNTDMSNTDYGSGIARDGSGTQADPYTYSVASDFVNRPVNYVSYWDSCRFANWMNNDQPAGAQGAGTTERGTYTLDGYNRDDGRAIQRNANWKWAVTSEDEWYKAAYYKGGSTNAGYFDYPTSSDAVPGRDLNDVSGNNANYYGTPCPIDSPYYTTVAGEFQNSDSPYGTFDQGGNVFEWNEAVLYGLYGSRRGLRGGSFGFVGSGCLLASCRVSLYSIPTLEGGDYGFRVSEVPEPATIVMLALASVGILRRKRA